MPHPPSTPLIDYQLLADAQHHYIALGYVEIPVPWIISQEAASLGKPPDRRDFATLDGYLNASGEQSFLELLLAGIHLKKHSCVTSCFRDEQRDPLHQRSFMKLELIDTNANPETLQTMLLDAKRFFDAHLPPHATSKILPTDNDGLSYDLVDGQHGIELGSYGIRSYEGHRWVYGTGVALPRLDIVRERTREVGHVVTT